MAFYPNERIAIFIDGANLYSTMKMLDFDIDYKKMLEFFKDKSRLIKANYYTALLENVEFSPIRPLIDWLDYNGYHVISKPAKQQIDREGRSRIKGNMDIEIVVDMIALAPHVDHMVLFSGDADFAAAIKAVQEKGVRVTVISSLKTRQPMLGDALRRQANTFLDIAEMDKIIGRPRREYIQYEEDDE
ncbi:MAG: NYN domain-containing protein [Litorimonas sp.]